eukprot:scaffold1355_cov268-Pinguiococcus_pyrenoidosus.AAC.55
MLFGIIHPVQRRALSDLAVFVDELVPRILDVRAVKPRFPRRVRWKHLCAVGGREPLPGSRDLLRLCGDLGTVEDGVLRDGKLTVLGLGDARVAEDEGNLRRVAADSPAHVDSGDHGRVRKVIEEDRDIPWPARNLESATRPSLVEGLLQQPDTPQHRFVHGSLQVGARRDLPQISNCLGEGFRDVRQVCRLPQTRRLEQGRDSLVRRVGARVLDEPRFGGRLALFLVLGRAVCAAATRGVGILRASTAEADHEASLEEIPRLRFRRFALRLLAVFLVVPIVPMVLLRRVPGGQVGSLPPLQE